MDKKKKEKKETKKIKATKVVITVDLDGPSVVRVPDPEKNKEYRPVDFLGF